MTEGAIRAVLFDFGGVILSSPIDAFLAYEAERGLPRGFVQTLNTIAPDTNAWACMERGEIDEAEFYARFEAEARTRGHSFDARALLARLAGRVRPEMVAAIASLRTRYVTACLTNNMKLGLGTAMAKTEADAREIAEVMKLFAFVVESCKIGVRKPEVAFYERACAIIGVAPEHCVFLDDLGMNLKPARALGMRTIKVGSPEQALRDLEEVLDHPVRLADLQGSPGSINIAREPRE
ncbi:MAG: HAD-superfamily hydrolase subfamily variant 3 [Labilithrix sp.]|nr:HAD-superfamily hydrolase subfamily variant 3 [Labilithrix sp.]